MMKQGEQFKEMDVIEEQIATLEEEDGEDKKSR